jgi:hypothetical protein
MFSMDMAMARGWVMVLAGSDDSVSEKCCMEASRPDVGMKDTDYSIKLH